MKKNILLSATIGLIACVMYGCSSINEVQEGTSSQIIDDMENKDVINESDTTIPSDIAGNITDDIIDETSSNKQETVQVSDQQTNQVSDQEIEQEITQEITLESGQGNQDNQVNQESQINQDTSSDGNNQTQINQNSANKYTNNTTGNATESTAQKKPTNVTNSSINKDTTSQESTLTQEQQYIKETKEKQALAKAKIKKLMPSIVNFSMTELQKVIAIHDWIVINMDYAYNDYKNGTILKDAHTAYGGLETGYVVCNGYAELFSYMTAEVGIESKEISGYGNIGLGDQHHRWSQVKIDGKWYNLDLTWDDPTWNNKEHDDNLHNSYQFFLLSDAEFYKTHRPYGEGETYTEKPSKCASSISIPDIINASVTKRAVYFTDVNDMARFKKDIVNIAKTDVEFFAVYCMKGDGEANKRAIDSVVVKTLKPYMEGGSSLSDDSYDIWFYERKDNILTATNEAECIAMIKKGIEAKKNGQEVVMRCVNEIFADDKENYNGDMYYNKESALCEAKVYRWTAKAGIQEAISCISGDGFTYIMIGDFNDGRKLIVAESPENALLMIKDYVETLGDKKEADMRIICVGDSLVPNLRNEIWLMHYLYENAYRIGYELNIMSEYDLGESVYMCIGVKVQ